MSTDILPAEWLDGSVESYLASYPPGAGGVYRLLLAALVLGGAALPLLQVDVAVEGRGLVRPAVEKHEVIAPAAGVVEAVRVGLGGVVRPGDTLVVLADAPVRARAAAVRARVETTAAEEADLARLTTAGERVAPDSLGSQLHAQSVVQLALELRSIERREGDAAVRRERAGALYARSLIPRAALEALDSEVAGLRAEAELLRERARARWHAELATARVELARLRVESQQVAEEADRLVVRAPVGGTLEELASISRGSFVAAGRPLGVISPDSRLLAEVWIAPRDVGLVRPDTRVRLEIHAFDYRDWGFVPGHVLDVSRDYLLVGETPFFRAHVALEGSSLRLANGATGRLQKGMTLTARFIVTRRSLWQLLWDRADDWLNPARGAPLDGGPRSG